MAASKISSVKSQKKSHSIRTALASAFLEWLLIFMLFIDAIFSYLITKFACFCELQTPCLLCSRLDHILGNKKLKYYWDLICGEHKLEISSLVLCHAHNKLVDVHGMCESCLFSFATTNKSNAETYRLLVGKLGEGEDSSNGLIEDPLLEDRVSSTRCCSCCNEPWIPRAYSQKLMQTKIIGSTAADFDFPLSGAAQNDQDNLKKIEPIVSVRDTHQRFNTGFDNLSHIGYTEVNVNSDTEYEFQFSGDGNDGNAQSDEINPKEDVAVLCLQTESLIVTLTDDLTSEKLIDEVTAPQTPISVSQIQSDLIVSHDVSLSPTISMEHGSEELHWQQANFKFEPSAIPEFIFLDDVPPSSIAKEMPIIASNESKHSFLDDVLPSSIAKETPVEASKASKHSPQDDVPPSLDAKENLVEESKESTLISIEEVPSSSIAKEMPITASKESNHSFLDDVLPSSIAKETPVEASKESKHSSQDDFPPSLDAKENLVEESKESTLISIDEVPSSSYGRGTPAETSEKSNLTSVVDILPSSESHETPAQILTENKLVSLVDVLPFSSAVETPVQGLKESGIARTEELWQAAVTECEEICKTRTESATMAETASETNPVSGDNGLQVPNLLDLGDAYKLAVGSRGRQFSGVLAEQWIGKDSSRLSDDLKLLFSQLSAAREQSMNDTSPRVTMSPRVSVSPKLSVNSDELKNHDASSTIGMQILQKRISLERNESGLSLDGSIVSEIEGESMVDRLNRQIEYDKKLLSALYKELEEERNASAIAANQAMAMITRLQEEKATLQMEALQYLRMMEEQAEYDMEALQKTNDLLLEREKEIQDLEAELEFYRNNFQNESLLEDNVKLSEMKTKNIKEEHPEASSVEVSTTSRNSVTDKQDIYHNVEGRNMSSGDKNIDTAKNSLVDLEDERSYILHCLKKLEKKLCLLSNYQMDLANSEYSGNIEERVNDLIGLNGKLEFQPNSGTEENDLATQNDRGNGSAQGHILSLEKSESTGNINNEIFYSRQSSPPPPGGIDIDSLANEVSELNERLKALEADKDFLEHSMNSIRSGDEGLQFIQEIASHLKEMRKIGISKREQSIT